MKRNLQRIYWVGIVITVIMAMIAVTLLVMFRIEDKRESLRSILEAASAWTVDASSDLQSHAEEIAAVSPPIRVTFMMDTGLVLADSQADPAEMENHFNRPEVQEALGGDVGESLRLSDTQSVFMLYAAKRVSQNLVLRLGYPVEVITRALFLYGIGLLVLFIVLSVVQRLFLTRFVVALSRQMDDVREILEGSADHRRAVFPEFQPAIDNIAYLARRLNDDLAEVNRTLTVRNDFIANASHELRSPLTSIMGFAEMLDEGLADTPEEQALCLKTIRGECQRMLDVVEDVLLLSRAERAQDLERTEVRVEEVAREICRALSPQAARCGIDLEVEGVLHLKTVEKDIWEILHNLVGNAIHYGRPGGHVRIQLKENAIAVEDDGIGIAQEHLPRVFEQFYRVDQTRDPSVRGTGLGLSIVRALAQRNGACVQVTSELGEGSCFTVFFGEKGDVR